MPFGSAASANSAIPAPCRHQDSNQWTGFRPADLQITDSLRLFDVWYRERDSNPHARRHTILNRARLPVPPPRHVSLTVPKRGLEPPRPFGHYHLKVARLPVPPPGHVVRAGGIEPPRVSSLESKSSASARSATLVCWCSGRDSNSYATSFAAGSQPAGSTNFPT